MGFLGLSEPIEKQDNIFQRLFWPGDHAGEVDSLGQQGFWICAVVALISAIALVFQGHWVIAFLTLAFFGLGGIGVREHSTSAAILVALAYILNQAANLLAGMFPSFLGITAAVLLIANIRGTWIAARWAKRSDPDAFPERMRETWKDRLVDQIPAQVWPKARVPFFFIAAAYMLLVSVGILMVVRHIGKPITSQQEQSPQAIYVKP
jgi:hypothetical protein